MKKPMTAPSPENMLEFIPASCGSERCSICGDAAHRKVEENIFDDDPDPIRHPLTAYVCIKHFDQIMDRTGYTRAPASGAVDVDWQRALSELFSRYYLMLPEQDDLRAFCIKAKNEMHMHPYGKMCRWLGYIQGRVIAMALTTVDTERDYTRPIFAELDQQSPAPEPVGDDPTLEELKGRIRYNLNETGCHYFDEGDWQILEAALSQTKKE